MNGFFVLVMTGFYVFSKANRARCSRCGFWSTEGRFTNVGYDAAKNQLIWECKARRACDKRRASGNA